jgi:hypothetical protein
MLLLKVYDALRNNCTTPAAGPANGPEICVICGLNAL